MKRNFELDKLRAFAIIFVMIVHFPTLKNKIPFLNPWSGVDLFFVISGFIVSKTFLTKFKIIENLSENKKSDFFIYIKSFFIKRFFRIIPIMSFLIILNIILYQILGKYGFAGSSDLWKEALYIYTYIYNFSISFGGSSNLGYHWSLSVEEQFYLAFPLFALMIKNNKFRIMFTILFILIVTLITRPYSNFFFGNNVESFYLTTFRADAILYGVLLYLLTQVKDFNRFTSKIISYRIILILVAFIFIISAALAPTVFPNPSYSLPIIHISSIILVYLASCEKNIIAPINTFNQILYWIGTRSYGLYLIHTPVIRLMKASSNVVLSKYNINIPYYIYFPITLFLLIIVTEFCFRFIEKPFIKLGHKIASRVENKISINVKQDFTNKTINNNKNLITNPSN
jgi:peptidoglycan/LPS O-acetylase OafA/YrhL